MMLALQMLQHVWTYKPLVHDALGMHANSVTIEPKAEPGQLPGTSNKKRYEVSHCSSFFHWHHGCLTLVQVVNPAFVLSPDVSATAQAKLVVSAGDDIGCVLCTALWPCIHSTQKVAAQHGQWCSTLCLLEDLHVHF